MENYEIINDQLKTKDGAKLFEYDGEINNSIHKIYIHSSINEIKENSFDKFESLEEIIVDENNAVYKSVDGCLMLNDDTLLFLPKNKAIPDITKRIAPYACKLASGEIILPEGVEEIAPYAFTHSEITALICNDNLRKIKEHSFEYCYNLEAIKFNEGIEEIGDFAFAFSAIKDLFIPSSVNSININPFSYCSCLESIKVSKENKHFSDFDSNVILRVSDSALISGSKNSIVPNITKIINDFSFARIKIEKIDIPDSVKILKDSCFIESNISYFDSNKITEIGESVFAHCKCLEQLKLNDNIEVIKPKFVASCSKLQEISIPPKVEVLPTYLFYDFYGTKVTIESTVKVIEKAAFAFCRNLITIIFNGTHEEFELAKGGRIISNCSFKVSFKKNEL